jgi:hypothetical protein
MVSAMTIGFAMIGFAAKAVIVLPRRFDWRCSRVAFDRNRSALAVVKNVGFRPLTSRRSLFAIATRAAKSTVQFFCALAFFVDAPGMMG